MCPFCDDEQLCILIKENGEEALSHTCREFPRIDFMTKETEEYYLSLACPAVVSFFKNRQEPLSFILEENEKKDDELKDLSDVERKILDELFQFIEMDMEIRNCMVDVLQNREWPLWFREFLVAYCLDKIKEEHNQGKAEAVYSILEGILTPSYICLFKEKLESAQKNEEIRFQMLRQITDDFSDIITGNLYLGRNEDFVKKIVGLFHRNLSIKYEEYKIILDKWRRAEKNNYDILMEHVVSYNWMLYAMTAFSKYYMVDNYWDIMIAQILIEHLWVIHYAIYEKTEWLDIEFIIALVCRAILHGRQIMKDKLDNLKKRSQISVSHLLLMIRP